MTTYPQRRPHMFSNSNGQNDYCEHLSEEGNHCGYDEKDHRWPCSPTCTHDDAWTPGHPERVKERSEMFMTNLPAPKRPPIDVGLDDADGDCFSCNGRHPHRLFGEMWRCSNCGAGSERFPCSPVCRHPDSRTPGHPERVKERSEAFNDTMAEHHFDACSCGHSRVHHPNGEACSCACACAAFHLNERYAARPSEYDRGAEAMRAACWEAIQKALEPTFPRAGWMLLWDDLKAAIDGAVP